MNLNEAINEKVKSKTAGEKIKELITGTPILQDPYLYIQKRYNKQLMKQIQNIREDILKEDWNIDEIKIIQKQAKEKINRLNISLETQANSSIDMSKKIQEDLLEAIIYVNIASYILNRR